MTMDIDALKADLARDEGFIPHAYQDSLGYWTIGCGRLIDEQLGGGISKEEALYLLGNDIRRSLADLDRALPWWRGLSEARMRALANMAFNLGITRLLGFRLFLAALEAGRSEEHTSELQSLMRTSYAVFCLTKNN